MQKKMEYIAVENRLLKLKLEKIITGKPWRIWMLVSEFSPKLISKKGAKKRYEDQMSKMSARAYKESVNSNSLGVEINDISTCLHHNNDVVINLNNQISTTVSGAEVNWMVKALQTALRTECYAIAEGLCGNILARIDNLDSGYKKDAIVLIVSVYVALGRYTDAITLLNLNIDIVFNNHVLFTFYSTLSGHIGANKHYFKLPNGKLNAFYVFNKRDEIHSLDYALGHSGEFDSNPQLNLLISTTLRSEKSAYLSYFNKALASYKVDKLIDIDLSVENVFSTIKFDSPKPVLVGPLVTVIMSAYNCVETVGYAIDSILNQSYMNLELLVCDDCSDDGTFEYITEFYKGDPRVSIFRSAQNQGTYNIRNAMISKAKGEFITFHDSDDYCLPSRICRQVAHLLEGNGIGCVTRLIRITEDGAAAFFKDHNAVRLSPVTFMAHARVFKDEKPYLSVKVGGDIEFMERLKETYGTSAITTIKSPLMLALWSSNSMTRTNGLESLENGYRAPVRRKFSLITFMQRLYGNTFLDHTEFEVALKESGNYVPSTNTIEY